VAVFTSGAGSHESGTAAALVRCAFADAALGALGTARGTAGAAALLAGGASALFAFAGAGARAGATGGAGAVGIHSEKKRWWSPATAVRERAGTSGSRGAARRAGPPL